jgi:methionyl aminopeptidase
MKALLLLGALVAVFAIIAAVRIRRPAPPGNSDSAAPLLLSTDAKPEEIVHDSRRAAAALSSALRELSTRIAPGLSTRDVNDLLLAELGRLGLTPTMRGFNGYPADTTVSVNEEILHAPPSARRLRSGDIVKVQTNARSGRAFVRQGWTFIVGDDGAASHKLVAAGHAALLDAIRATRTGARTGDIGHAIQSRIESEGFSVVRDYVGYAMGERPMEPPQLPCYGSTGSGPRLKPGQILNLHVIAKQGGFETEVGDDNWTVRGALGENGALFTAMVLVTDHGAEQLSSVDLPFTR